VLVYKTALKLMPLMKILEKKFGAIQDKKQENIIQSIVWLG